MLLLMFTCENERYGIDVRQIIEVVSMVRFKKIPRSPDYVAGLFKYRGSIVPVIDLTVLLAGSQSKPLLSTRIILVDYAGSDKERHILGLLAEKVTDTIMCSEADFLSPGIESDDTPYLGTITTDTDGMIQLIDPMKLLPESLQQDLFAEKKS